MKALGINRDRQKTNNVRQIIQLLYRTDSCSRVSLSKSMHLTQAAITKLVNPLIKEGYIEEVEHLATSAGRRPTLLKLVPDKFSIVGGRINRDYISAGLYSMRGEMLIERNEAISKSDSAESVFLRFSDLIAEVIAKSGAPILGIGIAVPGPFNMHTHRISLMSGFAGWKNVDIKDRLEERFCVPVFLEQDANCGAVAELWCSNRNKENIVYVTGDRGVGAGIVVDGSIYRGNLGYAGEFGHMSIKYDGKPCECGNCGCLELYCSSGVLEEKYLEKTSKNLGVNEILHLVKEGDETARNCYSDVIRALAFGCASLINVLNPDVIVFADKITEGGEFFLCEIRTCLKKYLMSEVFENLEIDVSRFNLEPTMLGASVIVLDNMLDEKFGIFSIS